jgi:phenylacetate-CoA ligase
MRILKRQISLSAYSLGERFGKRKISEKVKFLKEEFAIPFSEREAKNRYKLYNLLTHAQKKVPYYTTVFSEIGFAPEDILKDLKSLKKVPFLTKDIVRKHEKELLDKTKPHPPHMRRTGGSTGLSTAFRYDTEALDWTAAVNIEFLSCAGKELGMS